MCNFFFNFACNTILRRLAKVRSRIRTGKKIKIPHCFDPHNNAEIRIQICMTLQKSAFKSVQFYGLMQKDAKFCEIYNYMDSASKSA